MIAKADLGAAWESGFWRGVDYKGPLNEAAVAALNPYKEGEDAEATESTESSCTCEWLGDCSCELRALPVTTPAKASRIRLKTTENRGASNANQNTTASEPTHIKE